MSTIQLGLALTSLYKIKEMAAGNLDIISEAEKARQYISSALRAAVKTDDIIYLIPKKQGHKAHIWLQDDTACTMASTGGLNVKNYKRSTGKGNHTICTQCVNNYRKLSSNS